MSKKVKQISYLSAIIISVGSTIGAGIFFKNGTIFNNAGGSLGFLIASWLVAAVGVLAIGIAVVEVASKGKGKGGIMDWVKKFTPKRFAKYSASYLLFVYMPLTYFAMPIYAVLSLQDAMGSSFTFTGWEVIAIAFGFFLWIVFMGHFKTKTAVKVQWGFTILKFLPLVIVPILSMVGIGQDGIASNTGASANGLTKFSPWLGIMASIPAILFAVDGFYTVSSMELKDEKKAGTIMAVSISIIMAIYLFFSIFLGLNGAKNFGIVKIVVNSKWLGPTINAIIAIAVLGIINGFAMSVPAQYKTLHDNGQTDIISRVQRLFRIKKGEDAAFWTSVLFAAFMFVVLTPISLYVWNASAVDNYSASTEALSEMSDLVTNFTSLFLFVFIGAAIAGALKNRKTNKIEVSKVRFFIPAAWTAIVFIAIGSIYMVVENVVNISGINGADQLTEGVKFAILVVTSLWALIPTYWDVIKLGCKKTLSKAYKNK